MRYRPFFQRAHSPELTAGDRTQCVISVSTEFREGEKKKKKSLPKGKGCLKSSCGRKTWARGEGCEDPKLRKVWPVPSHISFLFSSTSFLSALLGLMALGGAFCIQPEARGSPPRQFCDPHLVCSGPSGGHSGGTFTELLARQLFWGLKEAPWALQPVKIVASFTIPANMSMLWSLVAAFYNSIFKMY